MEHDVADIGTALELADLAVFRSVASAGGVNGAARALRLPRSTISRRLARLEQDLGVRLFVRAKQRLSLTDDGARLLERTRGILDDVEDLVADARGVRTRVHGRLRMSAPLDLAGERELWLGLIARFPEVSFEVELTNRYVDVVREGYDIALRAGTGADASLVVRRLGTYALHAVASPAYVARWGKLRAPVELRAHSCLLLARFAPRAGHPGPQAPHRHVLLDDPHLVREGARRGLGIAILPASLVRSDIEDGTLVPVLDAYDPLRVPLYAVHADRRLLPATIRAVLDHFAAELAGT